MKCSNCGAEIENGSKFCTNCGKGINEMQATATTPVAPVAPTTPVAPVAPTPVQATPTPVQVTPTQVVQQPAPKKNNTALIIVLVVLGVLLLLGIGAVVVVRLLIGNFIEDIENFEPEISDIGNSNLEDGKVIKTITTPKGTKVDLTEDTIYIVKVDTSYLYDDARELRKKIDLPTTKEIEQSSATEKQKELIKKIVSDLEYGASSEKELMEEYEEDYSKTDIEYAIDYLKIDWEYQTKIAAIEILASGGFSKQGVINLLVFEGYDETISKKVVEEADFDYYEQALYEGFCESIVLGNNEFIIKTGHIGKNKDVEIKIDPMMKGDEEAAKNLLSELQNLAAGGSSSNPKVDLLLYKDGSYTGISVKNTKAD